MCALSSIPTTRISNAFVAQRMLEQIQSDQLNLFRVQSQLSSGRRITAPSDDAGAAGRAMALQSLLEQKGTVKAGLATSQTFLNASESAVGTAASTLNDVRAAALSAVGSTIGPGERQVVLASIDQAIDQFLAVGNQKFRDRYLFSGSTTLVQPFQRTAAGVAYYGNDFTLPAFSDVGVLFESNVTGHEVFGALSQSVRGSVDLNPALTPDTRLADLRGGQGIRSGSIIVSDGLRTSTINIAGAETIGDVARLIEANPPDNRTVTARVTARGLEVFLDSGNLSISEVGGGTTAAELGIKRPAGIGPGPIVGSDLDPRLGLGTRVADILGTRARAYLAANGLKNDLVVEAALSGVEFNDAAVRYVDDNWFQATPGLTAGNEFAQWITTPTSAVSFLKFPGRPGLDNGIQLTAATAGAALNNVQTSLTVRAVDGFGAQLNYNATTKVYSISVEAGSTVGDLQTAINTSGGPFTAGITTFGNAGYVFSAADSNGNAGNTYLTGADAGTLAVHIEAGKSTAAQARAAVNAQGTFTAEFDISEDHNNGSGFIFDSFADPGAAATTSGGSGEMLDTAAGMQIVNGGVTYAIDFSEAETVEDLLNAVNGAGADVVASINAAGTGIDIRSRLSGTTFSIGENGGRAAAQLGVRSTNESTALNSLNGGAGVRFAVAGDDFAITARDGTTFNVNLTDGNAAAAQIAGGGSNSGLLIRRATPGAAGNQFSVQIVDSGVGGGDSVSLVGNTLRFDVDTAAGFTAQEAVDLLAAHATLSTQFTARLDYSSDATNTGGGNLSPTGVVNFDGGRDAPLTIGDLLDLINDHPTNRAGASPVTARLSAYGNGIELVNDGPPASGTLSITRLGTSSAAQDLGLIEATGTANDSTVAGATAAAIFNFAGADNNLTIGAAGGGAWANGVVVHFANDGVAGNNSASYNSATRTLTIDVDPTTTTAQDIVDLLAGHPWFRATLTPTDGGATNTGGGTLGALPADKTLAGGTADVLTGSDANPQRVAGIFSALLQLRDAIAAGDQAALQAGIASLDAAGENLNFSRSQLGANLLGLEVLQDRLETDDISLRASLSEEIDVDFVAAVSEMASRQAALEASLKVAAELGKTTLLDYL